MSPVRAEPPRFSVLAPGIAHAVFKVRPPDAEPFSGHAFRIDLEVTELRLIPAGVPPGRRPGGRSWRPFPVAAPPIPAFFARKAGGLALPVAGGGVLARGTRGIGGALGSE